MCIIVSNDTVLVKKMDQKIAYEQFFLFQGCSAKRAAELMSGIISHIGFFRAGSTVYTQSHYEKALGFILSGEVDVCRTTDGKSVRLNRLSKNDSFGAAALFSEDKDYPTGIIAVKDTEILLIPQEEIEKLFKKAPELAINYIRFLSDKIRFLNRKIRHFSAPSAEAKVACRLLQKSVNGYVIIKNYTALADELSVGRASLYRTLDAFAEKGLLTREKNAVRLLNIKEIERISES